MTLMAMSVIAPGSAQFVYGNRRFGKIALWSWAGLLAVVLLVLWRVSLDDLARLAVRPWILTSFQVLAFIAALGWIVVLIDAWRLGHPPGLNRKHRLIMVGATLGLVLVVTTPFVMAARYAEAAHDLVVRMFPSGDVAAASDGRLNIALLGMDSGDGRAGARPDSIHVVSVDVLTGEPALISLPRNLENARFPEGTPAAERFPHGFSGEGDRSDYLLNATWTYGVENPELFEGPSGPGATAVKQAIAGTLGIEIHYYAAVDLMGFRDLVDALGGITIEVHQELPIGEKGRVLEPGVQELDGYHALWYARSRETTSDYDRMARQMCVLGAVLDQTDPRNVLVNFLDLADASADMVTTDIPRQDLTNLVDLALKAKDHRVMSLQFVPPLIVPADPDFTLIAEKTRELLAATSSADDATTGATPEADASESDGQSGASDDADGSEPAPEASETGTPADAVEEGAPLGVSAACSSA